MPSKTYQYKVVITNTIDNRGVKSGADELEQRLTKTEKRALKMIETVQKAFALLEKSGINTAKIDAAQSRIIAADEKALRAVRASEAQKIKLTEQTRREQIKTADLAARASERSAESQIRSARGVAREEQRSFQSRAKFATDYALKQERFNQAQFRSAQAYYRKMERQGNLESRRAAQMDRERSRNSQKRIEQVSTVGGGIQSAGVTATAIATAPIVAGLYAAIKIGTEYEQSMNSLQAVTNATGEEMKRADDLAIKLGNDLSLPGVSAKDAAEAMTELGKAGMTVTQAMAAARGTLQLSTAANISAAQAAEITANALNMFKLRAEDAGRVADLLAGAANASSAEITDVAASLQQAGSVFAAANIPIEDAVTLIAELANQGIKGSDAGTSLKTMMQRLQSPTDAAADALKALNVQVYDQQGKMKPMREIIGQFEKSLSTLSEQQKAQALNTIFGADAVRAANIVFGEGVAGFDKLTEAVQRTNAAAELAAARTKGLAGSWEALKSQAETLGLIIYNRIKEPLTEVVIYIATFASAITEAFLSLPEPAQKLILMLAGIAAAVGPILTVVGTAVIAFASLAEAVALLGGLAAVSSVVAAIAVVLAGLTAGVSAAIGVVYALAEAWENGFGPVASVVAVGAALILSALSPVLGIPVLIGAMLVTLYKIWETNFGGLRDVAIQVWNAIVQIVQKALAEISLFVGNIGGEILNWWETNYPYIEQIVKTVNDAIAAGVKIFLNAVSGFWEAHGETIKATVSYIWNAIKTIVSFSVTTIGDLITLALQAISGDWKGAWDTMLVILRRATKLIVGAIIEMNALIGKAIIAIGKWLYENSNQILRKIGEIVVIGLKYLLTTIALLPIYLIKLVPKFVSAGLQIGSAIWQGIKDGLKGGETAGTDDLGISVDDLFSFPVNPLENVTTGVDDLTKSMDKLGDITSKTTDKTTKFNRELANVGGKSRKKAADEIGNLKNPFAEIEKIGTQLGFKATSKYRAGGPNGATDHAGKGAVDFGFNTNNKKTLDDWTRLIIAGLTNNKQVIDERIVGFHPGIKGSKNVHLGNSDNKSLFLPQSYYTVPVEYLKQLDAKRRNRKGLNVDTGEINQEFNAKQSDELTKAERDSNTLTSIDIANLLKVMPDADVLRDYTQILIDKAKKGESVIGLKAGIQPTEKEVQSFFQKQGYREAPTVSDSVVPRQLDRRSQRFLETDESLNLTKRRKELDERRLYLADEILSKENDYILALEESKVDLGVEAELLKKRNLSYEAANEFARQQNSQTKELGDIEIALGVLRRQNADDQFVEQRRLLASKREQISLEQEITDLQDKLATQGENASLRYRAAWLKAIYDVRDADTRAVESQIESQVRIADQSVVHVEQIRADVLDALASQKSISETIADEIVGIYEKVGAASDKFLDKTIGKIPIIGGVAKNLARSFLTRITTGLLDTFLPGAGDALQQSGNPLLDENKKQTKSLQNIEKAVVGVGGIGNISSIGSGANASTGGGGILGLLKKLFGGRGSGSGSGIGGTPNFNPNAIPPTGTANAAGEVVVNGNESGSTSLLGNIKKIFGTGEGGLFAPKKNLLTGKDSKLGGILGGVGTIAQLAGGLIGGRAGNVLSYAGTGLQIGSLFGPWGAAIGAGIGALIGLFSGGTRKKDEKARNQAMGDAFAAIDALIAQVNNDPDFSDAIGIISQGRQIKDSYLANMSQLKDKKTRNIALRDVSRIEEKLRTLETLAKAKAGKTKSRADSLQLDVPTFADGGSISDFAAKNFQKNPLGYVTGPGSTRSDSILARLSHSEYVLDAETVKNLGVANLDRLRFAKGKLKYLRAPQMSLADGGFLGEPNASSGGGASSGGSPNIEVKNSFTYNEATGTGTVRTDVISKDSDGRDFIVKTVEEEIYRNGKDSRTFKANSNVAQGIR